MKQTTSTIQMNNGEHYLHVCASLTSFEETRMENDAKRCRTADENFIIACEKGEEDMLNYLSKMMLGKSPNEDPVINQQPNYVLRCRL